MTFIANIKTVIYLVYVWPGNSVFVDTTCVSAAHNSSFEEFYYFLKINFPGWFAIRYQENNVLRLKRRFAQAVILIIVAFLSLILFVKMYPDKSVKSSHMKLVINISLKNDLII